ncbi:MAG TPA: hypothetical protein VD907_01355 [Verrucomicrobiae bacterium]|nr:hypothetical protein [Verrucomicrobiae bacterium]
MTTTVITVSIPRDRVLRLQVSSELDPFVKGSLPVSFTATNFRSKPEVMKARNQLKPSVRNAIAGLIYVPNAAYVDLEPDAFLVGMRLPRLYEVLTKSVVVVHEQLNFVKTTVAADGGNPGLAKLVKALPPLVKPKHTKSSSWATIVREALRS